MNKQRKQFRLNDDAINILNEIKTDLGFQTETDTLIYIIKSYKERLSMRNELQSIIKEGLKNDLIRFRLGIRTAEQNSIVIKDILNTMLYEKEYDTFLPAYDTAIHPIIEASENRIKNMIRKNNTKKEY